MRDIKGFEGIYAVTSCGRVWSYRKNKFLKPGDNGKGYLFVGLCKNGKRYQILVHRLVSEAYIPNPNNLSEVNHKDEIKSHNWINNLEWCDHKYNINYGTLIEKISTKIQCVETKEVFDSLTDCERKTGCYEGSISHHLKGRRENVNGLHFIKI